MIIMKGMINMNNRNWIAIFLGLACLVLFVSVMGASNNWLNGNNNGTNNGTVPQQINQTVRDMNKAPEDGKMSTEIDANSMMSNITGTQSNSNSNNANTDKMPSIKLPQLFQ